MLLFLKFIFRMCLLMMQGCSDANLDLALALSVSMKEAEDKEILEEADVLSQAGLKTEAAQKRSTLEGFGFASTQPRTGKL